MTHVPAWLTAIPVAHRGLHDNATGVPENSIAAFKAAVDAGYGIELDVRLSADQQAVVFHDAKLDRLTGREGMLSEHTAQQLSAMPLLGTSQRIPLLADVLQAVNGRTPLLIEVKNYGNSPVGPLEIAVCAALGPYNGPYAVQSFGPLVVEWFRVNAPHMLRGQIATKPGDMRQLSAAEQRIYAERLEAGIGQPQFIAYDVTHLPSPLTQRARKAGMPVLTWTVRSPAQWDKAKAHADNLIFEHWRP
ncbi:MAG TPA: glycerophosphodiester phosphodiesterase [Candidatus Cybelea sp.]|nr:glycerophosphodiester phosphodiesterase [Candidatus Cybelea sp.]